MLFNIPDKKDQRIFFFAGNSQLGSITYNGNDLKMSSIYLSWWDYGTSIDLSDDYIFLSDYFSMYQVTKTSNYSDLIVFSAYDYDILDFKVYEDTGEIQ